MYKYLTTVNSSIQRHKDRKAYILRKNLVILNRIYKGKRDAILNSKLRKVAKIKMKEDLSTLKQVYADKFKKGAPADD